MVIFNGIFFVVFFGFFLGVYFDMKCFGVVYYEFLFWFMWSNDIYFNVFFDMGVFLFWVGVLYNMDYIMWNVGMLVFLGVKNVVEIGKLILLRYLSLSLFNCCC